MTDTRQWRVSMKTGDTWIVTADRLDPIASLGLSFSIDGATAAVVPFGTFSACEEIDPATDETPHIRKLPAPHADKAGPDKTKTQMIRAKPAGIDYYDECDASDAEHNDVSQMIVCIDWQKPEGEPLKDVKACFLESIGGFPPKTYKRFNEAVAAALEENLIEVFEA